MQFLYSCLGFNDDSFIFIFVFVLRFIFIFIPKIASLYLIVVYIIIYYNSSMNY